MKLNLSSLVRTNEGFPTEWSCNTLEGKQIKISYRYGRTKILVEGKVVDSLSIDQFDIGGYMEDDALQKLLKINGYI